MRPQEGNLYAGEHSRASLQVRKICNDVDEDAIYGASSYLTTGLRRGIKE